MLIALIVILGVWVTSFAIREYWLGDAGIVLSLVIAIVLGLTAAAIQVFVVTHLNESSGISVDAMSYVRNAFLTLCISIYVAYKTLRNNGDKGVENDK